MAFTVLAVGIQLCLYPTESALDARSKWFFLREGVVLACTWDFKTGWCIILENQKAHPWYQVETADVGF